MKTNKFWNTCPKQLEYFPNKVCSLGKKSLTEVNPSCAWYINSEEDFFCFWKWLRRISNKEGGFHPLHQHQVAALLKWSTTKTHQTFKEALDKIKDCQELQDLEELYF